MFAKVAFKPFLEPFVGEVHEDLVFVPNISYPTDQEIGLRIEKRTAVCDCAASGLGRQPALAL